jgi:zinc protease
MKRLFVAAFALALFGIASLAAGESQLKLPPYSRVMLSNGITALLMEQHEVPIVSFSILITAGSVEDPAGKEGLASLTAELLRRGTKSRSAEQIASELDFLGGGLDFAAGLDFSAGGAEFLSKDTSAGLALLTDVLFQANFPKEEVDKRIQQRVDELKSLKDEPQSVLTNYFHAFLFGDHPYGRSIDGDEATNAKLTREEAIHFYQEHYVPNQIRIAAVGDFTMSEMVQLLQKTVGAPIRTSHSTPAKVVVPEPIHGRKLLLVDKPDATQSFYVIGNVGISRTNADRVPIQLVNTLFGGRFTSMLNDELRVSSGLTYGAHSQFGRYRQPGPFSISSFTQNSNTVRAIDMTLDVLKKLHVSGLSNEQLKSAQAYIKGQFPPQIETTDHLASLLTQLDFFGLDEREINEFFNRIDAVTLADCKRVIDQYFPSEDLVFTVIGKASEIGDSLKKYAPTVEKKEITQVGYR